MKETVKKPMEQKVRTNRILAVGSPYTGGKFSGHHSQGALRIETLNREEP